jgi:hypothetical protein
MSWLVHLEKSLVLGRSSVELYELESGVAQIPQWWYKIKLAKEAELSNGTRTKTRRYLPFEQVLTLVEAGRRIKDIPIHHGNRPGEAERIERRGWLFSQAVSYLYTEARSWNPNRGEQVAEDGCADRDLAC